MCDDSPDANANPKQTNFSLVSNNNMVPGDIVSIGCALFGTVSNYISCPAGFVSAGEATPCSYCWNKVGYKSKQSAGCGANGCAIGGAALKCKMTEYTGDHGICCSTGGASDGKGGACSPEDSKRTSSCSSYFVNNCSDPNSAGCSAWIQKVGYSDGNVQDVLKKWCAKGDNITTDTCKNYCHSGVDDSTCDAMAKTYCEKTPANQEFCGCYNTGETFQKLQSDLEKIGTTITPQCNAPTCASNPSAYKPKEFRGAVCSPVSICNQTLNINSNSVTGANITQNCSQKTGGDNLENKPSKTELMIEYMKNNSKIIIVIATSILILLLSFFVFF